MGVDFSGNGDRDVSISKDGTNPGDLGSSGGGSVIDFAGDGEKDVWNNSQPSLKGAYALDTPKSGNEVKFAGDGKKDA